MFTEEYICAGCDGLDYEFANVRRACRASKSRPQIEEEMLQEVIGRILDHRIKDHRK
jgi:hypothetical protein